MQNQSFVQLTLQDYELMKKKILDFELFIKENTETVLYYEARYYPNVYRVVKKDNLFKELEKIINDQSKIISEQNKELLKLKSKSFYKSYFKKIFNNH